MRRLAVAMAKGGVGKTTTAVNLAHALALQNRRVLLVDCDTQGQTAKFLGMAPRYGLYEFVTGYDEKGRRVPKREVVAAARENLWLLAGGIKLVELKHWLGEQPRDRRQTLLARSLVPRSGALDYLIFDGAPGWDVLSVNILMAVDEVLCPVAVQAPALEGLKTFFGYLLSAQKLNPALQLRYVLPTLYDLRTRHSETILRHLKRLFQRQICAPVHYNVRLCEAPAFGKTVFEYSPKARGASDYQQLARRVLNDEQA